MKTSLPQTLVVLAVLVGLVATQQLFSLPGGSALMRATQDALHAPWFFAVVVVLCWWLRDVRWPARLLIVVVLGTVLAAGTEFAQLFVESRSASVGDLRRDLVGGVLGLIFAFALIPAYPAKDIPSGGQLTPMTIGVGCAVLLALAIYTALPPWQALELRRYRAELAPAIVDLADERAAQFLSSFLSMSEGSRFRIEAGSSVWPRYRGQPLLRLDFGANEYPTLYINELMQLWAPYTALVVDVFVLGEAPLPLTLAVQYEGSAGTSAYHEVILVPGENLLRIPRAEFVPDEAIALRVRDLLVYTTADHAGRAVLLGAIRLR